MEPRLHLVNKGLQVQRDQLVSQAALDSLDSLDHLDYLVTLDQLDHREHWAPQDRSVDRERVVL